MDGEALIERFKRENPDLYRAGILEALNADILAAVKEGHSPEEALDRLRPRSRSELIGKWIPGLVFTHAP